MASTLPSIMPPNRMVIHPEPLTPSAFAPFGTAILSPISPTLTRVPTSLPQPLHPQQQPNPQYANQNTALKTSPISPLINEYPAADASQDRSESRGAMSVFSCFPRQNTYLDANGTIKLKVSILERHPFTTQTFCPFNFSERNLDSSGMTYFLVIVAPTLSSPTSDPPNPPDLTKIRAFLAPTTTDGGLGMAVTYNPGTWHAPMVVLGERRVDFLVTQFVNGKPDDDCQEVLIGTGFEQGISSKDIEVDLRTLNMSPLEGLNVRKAKL